MKAKIIELTDSRQEHIAFCSKDQTIPPKDDRSVYVRPLYFGLNAGMRSRIGLKRDGAGTLEVGDVPTSDAVVERVEGDGQLYFVQWCPWAEYVAVPKEALIPLPTKDPIPYLTILGHTGFTAWVSMELAKVRKNDHVVVSGAAGGVGNAVIQWAKLRGAKVTGMCSTSRLPRLESLLSIPCIDRTKASELPEHSVYHDGVGGVWLERAIDAIVPHGRIMICGNLSGKFPNNFSRIIHKNVLMQGFTVMSYTKWRQRFWQEGLELLDSGKLQILYEEHEGLDQIGEAFLTMGERPTIGRHIVKVR